MSNPVYRNLFSMGTRLDIIFTGIDDELADNVCMLIKSDLDRLENKISNHIENSPFSLINRDAALRPVTIESDLISLVEELKELSEKTEGYYDFAFTGVKPNRVFDEPESIKNSFKENIQDGKAYRNIETSLSESTIFFNNELISLDSGGFGKGLGLDFVKKILEKSEISSAFISFGESSVLAHGKHPFGEKWKTGIKHQFIENENVFIFDLLDEFLSVSGITPQNIRKHGSGHIVNPFTRKSPERFMNSAVAGPVGLITEVISTALLVAPLEIRDRIMTNFPDYSACVIEYDESNIPEIIYKK